MTANVPSNVQTKRDVARLRLVERWETVPDSLPDCEEAIMVAQRDYKFHADTNKARDGVEVVLVDPPRYSATDTTIHWSSLMNLSGLLLDEMLHHRHLRQRCLSNLSRYHRAHCRRQLEAFVSRPPYALHLQSWTSLLCESARMRVERNAIDG